MNPDEHPSVSLGLTTLPVADEPSTESADTLDSPAGDNGWRLWPPSPKMQIAMIAIGFGLFNLLLIVIWAAVMVYRF